MICRPFHWDGYDHFLAIHLKTVFYQHLVDITGDCSQEGFKILVVLISSLCYYRHVAQ